MNRIDVVWQRIKEHEGEQFYTITGKAFNYSVKGDYVELHNTNQSLPKSYFSEALTIAPLQKPSDLKYKLPREPRGTSYIFAILTDKRISTD